MAACLHIGLEFISPPSQDGCDSGLVTDADLALRQYLDVVRRFRSFLWLSSRSSDSEANGRRRRVHHISRFALPLALATVSSIALSGCSAGTLNQQVSDWANNTSLNSNDSYVIQDVDGIAAGIKGHNLAATHTACDGLGYDAGTAYGQLPAPDNQLTNDLNRAYLDYTLAGQECSSAKSFGKAFKPYERDVARANAALEAARQRLRALGVGSVPR
jgi:hypothetical protein